MQFKAVPEEQDLQKLVRQFQFFESRTTDPKSLTRADIEAYNRDGYLKSIGALSDEEVMDFRGYFDDLLAKVIAAGGDSYSISTAHLKHGRVYDLLTHPRIVAAVRDILGDDVVGWGSHFFCKMPHDGKAVAWHQDGSYWPLTPSKTATVWLAIDDADTENACMQFISGSHQFGHIPYRTSSDAEGNVLNQTVDNPLQYGSLVNDELKAGEISIHADLLLHGSEANDSDRRRCGLTLRYCAADVRAGSGWEAKGVVVSGQDPSGHWANPQRPAED
ncbi:MAG: phytanoyl-CoA dioxygenase family protein [Acidobacteria bacterium]|nr:phytanoyl-CoA dioxygenase family protein [Acidobacteriota bacterium]MDA1234307.1 phytanoyl-CoA dioxygenase family protein [Acidobacteriota bacterium]